MFNILPNINIYFPPFFVDERNYYFVEICVEPCYPLEEHLSMKFHTYLLMDYYLSRVLGFWVDEFWTFVGFIYSSVPFFFSAAQICYGNSLEVFRFRFKLI